MCDVSRRADGSQEQRVETIDSPEEYELTQSVEIDRDQCAFCKWEHRRGQEIRRQWWNKKALIDGQINPDREGS